MGRREMMMPWGVIIFGARHRWRYFSAKNRADRLARLGSAWSVGH
jgi:hypothetical protein